jgi:hypothetical protein
MAETAGTGCTPAFPRWTAMVSAPASRPSFDSCLRSLMIWSSTSRLTARGLEPGQRSTV